MEQSRLFKFFITLRPESRDFPQYALWLQGFSNRQSSRIEIYGCYTPPREAIHKTPNRRPRLLLKYQYATRIMLLIAVSHASYSV